MAQWLNTIEGFCDPARQKEFSDWYDNIHLGDILKTPGFLAGRRYEAREFRDGRGTYLTTYDIETDDIDRTMAVRIARRREEIEQGRGITVLTIIWKDVLWKLIAELVPAQKQAPQVTRWVNLVETNCVDASREKEFNDWYTNIHLPDVLDTPGFTAARRYEAKEFRDGRGKYLAVYEIETDDIDRTMAVRLEKRKREVEQGHSCSLMVPVWRDVLWKLVSERSAHK